MTQEFDYEIDEHGTLRAIYDDDDELLQAVGTVKSVERLSHVEWEGPGWTVRSAADLELALRVTGPESFAPARVGELVHFTTRADALKAEREYAWDLRRDSDG